MAKSEAPATTEQIKNLLDAAKFQLELAEQGDTPDYTWAAEAAERAARCLRERAAAFPQDSRKHRSALSRAARLFLEGQEEAARQVFNTEDPFRTPEHHYDPEKFRTLMGTWARIWAKQL